MDIRIHHYFGGILLQTHSPEELMGTKEHNYASPHQLQLLDKCWKSQLQPMQVLVYLRMRIDIKVDTISLPAEKVSVFRSRVWGALVASYLKASQCLRITGTMVSVITIVKWA